MEKQDSSYELDFDELEYIENGILGFERYLFDEIQNMYDEVPEKNYDTGEKTVVDVKRVEITNVEVFWKQSSIQVDYTVYFESKKVSMK